MAGQMGQSDTVSYGVGDCRYSKVIPQGSGGYLDLDTLYALARSLPRSTRSRMIIPDTQQKILQNLELLKILIILNSRQPLALEVLESVAKSLDPGSKIYYFGEWPID